VMCVAVFIVIQALGQTHVSGSTPEFNTENLLVLLTPLAVIFGVAFFLTLLNQMNLPSLQARFGVVAVLVALIWQPLVTTVVIKASTLAYPPYYPPDVQKIAGWMHPNELIMSDIPWAVAWYGDRQCTLTTINSQYEFFSLNDYIKPVHGLYLSFNTLNDKLLTECLQGGVDSWGYFVWQQLASNNLPTDFPMKYFPLEALGSGMFIADSPRW
jgi:hypothetical protein